MTNQLKSELTTLLIEGSSHKIEDDGRGGYRCSGCSLEFDWTHSEKLRAATHSKEELVNKLLVIINRENASSVKVLETQHSVQVSQAVSKALDFVRSLRSVNSIDETIFEQAYFAGVKSDK